MASPQRRRLVVTAAVVSAVAFGIGWMLGRGSDAPRHAGAATVTATSPPPGLTGSTVPTVDPALLAGSTTTTIAAGWTTVDVNVDPRAAALGVHVVGVRSGRVVELDTATGTLAQLATDTRYEQTPQVEAGTDWFLVRRPDVSFSELFRGRDQPVPVTTGYTEEMFAEPGTDRFWRVFFSFDSRTPTRVAEVDERAEETGVGFEFHGPGRVVGADPVGGVIVVAPGGAFHAGTDGSNRITGGDVIAIGDSRALITDCSDNLTTCGLVVLDRSSGATKPLVPVLPIDTPDVQIYESGASYGLSSLLSDVSPDGRYAPLVINGTRLRFGVIDLDSGDFSPLGISPQSGLWWAPDSRSVMYVFNEHLLMFDFETRRAFDVVPGLQVTAFAVRPAA